MVKKMIKFGKGVVKCRFLILILAFLSDPADSIREGHRPIMENQELIMTFMQILILIPSTTIKEAVQIIQKDILPFHRFNLSRQIGQNVIINSGFHIADRGWNQQ